MVLDVGKEGKLTDLSDGTPAQLRLSADKATVLDIHAEGPSYHGVVKAVDTEKNSITLTITVKKGADGEVKTFTTTKTSVVVTAINGAPLKLSDVRAEQEVVVRLTVDQKTVAKITVLGE